MCFNMSTLLNMNECCIKERESERARERARERERERDGDGWRSSGVFLYVRLQALNLINDSNIKNDKLSVCVRVRVCVFTAIRPCNKS